MLVLLPAQGDQHLAARKMSADADAPLDAGAFVRGPATWYSWLLTGAFIYIFNVQGKSSSPFCRMSSPLATAPSASIRAGSRQALSSLASSASG